MQKVTPLLVVLATACVYVGRSVLDRSFQWTLHPGITSP
jgi:hypothetical protein